MRHRSDAGLTARTVVTVQRGTTFKEIARLLDKYGITAVPVIDDGRPVGMVSEADLLPRHTSSGGASTAEELMSSPAVVHIRSGPQPGRPRTWSGTESSGCPSWTTLAG